MYYAGGWSAGPDGGTFRDALLAFDPSNASVSALAPIPEVRVGHALVAHGDALYLIGGMKAEKQPLDTVWRYDPSAEAWSEMAPLRAARSMFACASLGDRIAVAGGWKRMFREASETLEFYVPEF